MSSETHLDSSTVLSGNRLSSVAELAAVLAEIHVALASATNEQESLAAVMRYIARTEPLQVALYSVGLDDQGQPNIFEAAALWSEGTLHAGFPAHGKRYLRSESSTTAFVASNPQELLEIADAMNDPRVDAVLRAEYEQRGVRGLAVLPLYSVSHAAWQGILTIHWRDVHPLAAEERSVLSLIMATLASFLANQRSDRVMRAALKERQEQSTLLRVVLDNLPVGVGLFEAPSGKPILENRAVSAVVGRRLERTSSPENDSVVYRPLRPGTDEVMANEELPLVRTLTTGKTHSGDLDIIGDDNERHMVEATAVPILDESGQIRNAVLLMVDATQRKRAENERLRMQEELITVQAAALAERSTPLIPITDEIVVVPLIGSLDSDRGAQLLDTLLSGVSQNRARVAIIDITGVRTLDTQAARTLTSAAQALRLLGVEPVLTGIRAEVAQTLITLGVRLDGIATRNNLQSGIALAQRFVSQKTARSHS